MGAPPADTLEDVVALDSAARRRRRTNRRRPRGLKAYPAEHQEVRVDPCPISLRNRRGVRRRPRGAGLRPRVRSLPRCAMAWRACGDVLDRLRPARWRPGRTASGTIWKLAWIPLGGYVKLHGQERPQDVPPEVARALDSGPDLPGKAVRFPRDHRGGRSGGEFRAGGGAVRRAVRGGRPAGDAAGDRPRWCRTRPPRPPACSRRTGSRRSTARRSRPSRTCSGSSSARSRRGDADGVHRNDSDLMVTGDDRARDEENGRTIGMLGIRVER